MRPPRENEQGVPVTENDKWAGLTDANGQYYDPRPALATIASGTDKGYAELLERLRCLRSTA
jgi:hypothetical protein